MCPTTSLGPRGCGLFFFCARVGVYPSIQGRGYPAFDGAQRLQSDSLNEIRSRFVAAVIRDKTGHSYARAKKQMAVGQPAGNRLPPFLPCYFEGIGS